MTTYRVTARDAKHFSLLRHDHVVGSLSYPRWFSLTATMQLGNKATYQVASKGQWGTTIELKEGPEVLLSVEMSWNGNMLFQPEGVGAEKGFVFRLMGGLRNAYSLIDGEQREVAVIQPDFSWRKASYNYMLTTTDDFDRLANQEMLLLLAVHCANYYMNSTAAALLATV